MSSSEFLLKLCQNFFNSNAVGMKKIEIVKVHSDSNVTQNFPRPNQMTLCNLQQPDSVGVKYLHDILVHHSIPIARQDPLCSTKHVPHQSQAVDNSCDHQ